MSIYSGDENNPEEVTSAPIDEDDEDSDLEDEDDEDSDLEDEDDEDSDLEGDEAIEE